MGQAQNRIIAEDLWNAIAAADIPTMHSLLSEKCVWRMNGSSLLAGTFSGPDEIVQWTASIGELADDLQASLIDVFSSASGAVLRYRVRAVRGPRTLDVEHLFMITVEDGRITEAVFAPIDQLAYDRFFAPL